MSTKLVLDNKICHVVIEESSLTGETVNPGKYTPGELAKVIRVCSSMQGVTHSISILCSYMTDLDNSAFLKGDHLILMLNEQLFRISMKDCIIREYKQLDIIGCTFGLYETTHGYVVHGELDILMLDPNFELLWDFSGRDIFVSITGKTAFTLTDTTIQLYDFEDNYYEINMNGKLLHEQLK